MTATDAVKMIMARCIAGTQADAMRQGREDADQADVIFAGLEEDGDFQAMAEAHSHLIQFAPARVCLSMMYIGYMAAKMENGNAAPDSCLDN